MATQTAAALQRKITYIDDFLAAFRRLMGFCEHDGGWGGLPVWQARPSMATAANDQAQDVARTATAAAVAVQEMGALAEHKPPGTWATNTVNPVLVWQTLFGSPMTSVEIIEHSCQTARGLLTLRLDAAVEHESSAAGKLEQKLREPRKVFAAFLGQRREVTPAGWLSSLCVAFIAGLAVLLVAHYAFSIG